MASNNMTEAEKKEQKRLEEILDKIHYSDKYSDDFYEYRHVILPKQLLRMVPPAFFLNQEDRHGPLRILAEEEWRSIGIQQSLGWEHYEIHAPEPHVLLFRRALNFTPPAQPPQRKARK